MSNEKLKLKYLEIDAGRQPDIFLLRNSNIVKSEGFAALDRIKIFNKDKVAYATLFLVDDEMILAKDEVGVSKKILNTLKAHDGELFELEHMGPLASFDVIRQKLRGARFTEEGIYSVIKDVVDGKYTDMHMACLCSATEGTQLNDDEIAYFAKAMVKTGQTIKWNKDIVVDKHCIGGVPGNRTTPTSIAVVAEYGMFIPKTSSRAITSPSGTADTMEVLTNVDIPSKDMKAIVEKVNGCLVWGGGVDLNPSDDIIINVKKDLNLDSKGQMLASILSKKAAAGSTHVLIDIPYGTTAKVKTLEDAQSMKKDFETLGSKLGMHVYVNISDGSQPVGNGVGPALEAQDVVDVLQNKPNAPQDLKEKTIKLSGLIIEFDPKVKKGDGEKIAREILESGRAWARFEKICEAQGGLRKIPVAKYTQDILATKSGEIVEFDNKKLANMAKLAGCPARKASGLYLYKHLGDKVVKGEKLFTLHAESQGELELAAKFAEEHEIIKIK